MNAALESEVLPAFPAALAADVRAVVGILPRVELSFAIPFGVRVCGEHLSIPCRLYGPEPAEEVSSRLSPTRSKILHCLYTRHHDGYVRQRHLNRIVDATDPWVIPFVVQLIGEYVLEIIIDIQRGLTDLDRPGTPRHRAYARFAAANPDFLHLTSQRVTSYWNCYYRKLYAHRDYPGRVLIDSLLSPLPEGGNRSA